MLEQVTRRTGAEGLGNLSRCVQPVKLRHADVDDDKSYERDGDEMASSGPYVELEPGVTTFSGAIALTAMNRTGPLISWRLNRRRSCLARSSDRKRVPKRFLGYFSMARLNLRRDPSRGKRRWLKSNGILRSPHTVRSDSCIAKAGLLICRVPRCVRPVFCRWANISDLAKGNLSVSRAARRPFAI
jgi:hypothetical protein